MDNISKKIGLIVCFLVSASLPGPVQAQTVTNQFDGFRSPFNPTASRDRPRLGPRHGRPPPQFPDEIRTLDGGGNNGANPRWGAAGTELLRLTAVDYGDDNSPAGSGQISPREISNLCVAQDESIPSSSRASDFVWQWGQFLDHDIDLIAVTDEPFDIPVPYGDAWFDPPPSTGKEVIPLDRSDYKVVEGVRQQVNEITAYIDASNVYGSDQVRANALRTFDGGRLKTSSGDLLPFNVDRLDNAPTRDPSFFLAGDFRANEQVALTAMHTLFVREHNHWADMIGAQNPLLGDNAIYEMARAIVGAEMQAITYNRFLPVLLGRGALSRYRGYKPQVNASIANVFSTAAYRFGHSMLSATLLRLDANGEEIDDGNIPLEDAFFNPEEISKNGIESLLRGLASQRAQEVDTQLVDAVRNFLFGPGGFDLAALNIQRGRDHGLPPYNDVREDYGLPPVTDWTEITDDPALQVNLAQAYASVDDMDIWVGGLAETHVAGALVGETFRAILTNQFERLRDGDRFWYQSYLPRSWRRLVERQTLPRIIRRNTEVGRELRGNIFRVRAK